MGEKTNQLLADSRLAFLNQQNGKALNLALEAIKLDPKNADAYKCAGNAYMSMERYEEAARLVARLHALRRPAPRKPREDG